MSKRGATILLACIALMCLVGCGHRQSTSTSSVTQLEFWNGFSGPDGTTMERIVREFNATHRDIRVRMQIIPWGTYYDKVTLGLAFGGAPDVFILHADRLPQYADRLVLRRLDGLVARGNLTASDFMPRGMLERKALRDPAGLPPYRPLTTTQRCSRRRG